VQLLFSFAISDAMLSVVVARIVGKHAPFPHLYSVGVEFQRT
jgi:hypothetical protein